MNIIKNQIVPLQPDKTAVGIDSEWHGMKTETLHRPTSGEFACATISPDGENVYFLTDKEKVTQSLKNLANTVWIMQESKFDLTQLGRFVPKEILNHKALVDTLLMEKVLYSGYYNRFGLDHLARRYLGEQLDKSLQKSFTSDEMSPEQITYACKDAAILPQIWNEQKKNIKQSDMYIYKNIDLPMTFSVMDFLGFGINADGWRKLAEENKAKQEEINEKLPIKPSQFAKLKTFLRGHGFPKLESTNEDSLIKAYEKYPDTEAGQMTRMILDSRMYGDRASKYGTKWLENYLEQDEDGTYFVMPNWNVLAAETGRMSATNPPLQTIPIRETKVYRELFIPRKNHVLIVGDFQQQEVGVLAYICQDKKLIEMFNQGGDVYILAAKEMYGLSINKGHPLRKRMKSLVLGIDYGLSKYGLARRENMDVDEAEEHIQKFLRLFPGIRQYQYEQEREKVQIKTILGRRIYLNAYSPQCKNNSLNGRIQGSAADMLKIVINDLHAHWNLDCPFGVVAPIHDELVLDVPKECAYPAFELLKETMESLANWMCGNQIKFTADVHICNNSWADKNPDE